MSDRPTLILVIILNTCSSVNSGFNLTTIISFISTRVSSVNPSVMVSDTKSVNLQAVSITHN